MAAHRAQFPGRPRGGAAPIRCPAHLSAQCPLWEARRMAIAVAHSGRGTKLPLSFRCDNAQHAVPGAAAGRRCALHFAQPTCRRSAPCGKRGAWSLRSRREMRTAAVALRRGRPASVTSTRSSWCARSSRSSAAQFMISPDGETGEKWRKAFSVCQHSHVQL